MWSSGYDATSTKHFEVVEVPSSKPYKDAESFLENVWAGPLVQKRGDFLIKNSRHRQVFFYATFIILILLSAYFIFPFIKSVLVAMMLSFVFFPLYKRINIRFNSPRISATIVTLIVLLIFLVPFTFVVNEIVTESTVTFIVLKQKILAPQETCTGGSMCKMVEWFENFIKDPKIKFYLNSSIEKFMNFVTEEVSTFIVSLPKAVLNIFIAFVSFFYFLKDGEYLIKKIEEVLPIRKENREHLFERFTRISKAIVFGYMITALIQGATALLGFYLVNLFFSPESGVMLISTPLLWAIILALLSMIPIIGSGFVWVPISAVITIRGYLDNDTSAIAGGIFLFFYGLILISNIDNVVRPLLSGRRAKVHQLVVFLGIFGGLATIGIVGIFVGPLVLALLLSYIQFYERDAI